MTTVVHCKRDKFDIYIGRPSRWGNPFSFKKDSIAEFIVPKDQVLPRYSEWVKQQRELMDSLYELNGKILGCWCKPIGGFNGKVLCHGQILAALADGCNPEDIE